MRQPFKDSPVCLDLEYYQPKNKTENYYLDISGSSLHSFKWCSKFFSEKRIHNTFQIRGEKTHETRFFKNQVKFVNFRMKWVVLPFSEPYTEVTKCNEVKIYSFSCNQVYY